MSETRSTRTLAVLCGLASPLLLAHCGSTSNDGAVAGAAGVVAESGAAGALGGAIDRGGAMNGGSTNGGATSGAAAGELAQAGLAGQSSAGAAGASGSAGSGGDSQGAAGSGGACAETLSTFSSPSANHVTVCSAITYPMNPPVYGDHYPIWAQYKSYSFPVPLGFLVHNLEHGAVELLYNCPQGCADEVATAQAFLDALPMDPRCSVEVKHQTILSPDPTLPSRWAAVAWGRSLTADCFDGSVFRSFYDANIGHGPEDICSDGAELTSDICL